MDAENSNQIVKWGADKFDSAVFITYEMILPDDPFGSVMLKNLEVITKFIHSSFFSNFLKKNISS